VSGGAALTLTDAATTRGASWGKQGTIAFTPLGTGTVLQMSDSGGSPQPLTQLHKGDTGNRWPDFLPGGRAVLFAGGTSTKPRIGVRSIQTGEQRVLIQAGGYPRYAPSGHLVYVQSGTLMATPFDLQRLEVSGEGVPVVESVLRSTSTGSAQYSVSETGWLVYVPGGPEADQRKLVWVSRNGTEQPLAAPVRTYEIPAPRLSRDGKRLGVVTDSQVWLYDVPRETLTRFTFEGDTNNFPVWSPDSKRIAFDSDKEGPLNLFWQRADGSGGLERLTRSEFPQYPLSFSPDGQLLAFVEVNPTTSYDIWVLHLADRKAQPFLRTTFLETAPQFSPDGHWLAYVSNESGRFEVYVQPYPGPGGKWQISTDGGTEPMWNPNGRELFYRNGDKMMAVEIATQPTFSAGKARVLFERHYMPTTGTIPAYDVTPDGQRFLMASDSESATPATQINVVLNWTEELKRLVPAGTK
jgi:Tol biopolymer transport system component